MIENYEKHMQPIYDNKKAFEDALDKAWKQYEENGWLVDRYEDDFVECAHAKGFREGFLFGLKFKENDKKI